MSILYKCDGCGSITKKRGEFVHVEKRDFCCQSCFEKWMVNGDDIQGGDVKL